MEITSQVGLYGQAHATDHAYSPLPFQFLRSFANKASAQYQVPTLLSSAAVPIIGSKQFAVR